MYTYGMKTAEKTKHLTIHIILISVFLLCGCSTAKNRIPQTNTDIPETVDTGIGEQNLMEQAGEELYLVTAIDSSAESIQLYRYRNGKEYLLGYSVNTVFRDKYRNRSTISEFYPGRVVTIGDVDAKGIVAEVAVSDSVWKYDDIVRFSIDEANNTLKIADSNYRITEQTKVFSDTQMVDFSVITKNDKLSVIGQDKNILSVCITTGHGILKLQNTELFEGSFLQLGTKIFAEITPNMELEIPEGQYVLAVANNGWGGNCTIDVLRGETTEVDLDSIKGEGPKFGSIRFVFDIEDVALTIDGETIDYSEPVVLQYGRHLLKAGCTGYESVSKYLFVNSEEATIMMDFMDEAEKETEKEETEEPEKNTESSETKENDTNSGDLEEVDTSTREEFLKDYLSTLTELIDSL